MVKEATLYERFQTVTNQFLEGSYEKSRELVLPWTGEMDPELWIEDMRHEKSACAVLSYLKNTKGNHDLRLLGDVGRDVLRIQKDQELEGTSTQQRSAQGYYWWGQGSAFLEDVGDRVAFYLLYGCKANEEHVVSVMRSLGWHEKGAKRKIRGAREHLEYEYEMTA